MSKLIVFLFDRGLRLLDLGTTPSLCNSFNSLILIVLLLSSFKSSFSCVLFPENMEGIFVPEVDFATGFNPDNKSDTSEGPFISGRTRTGFV